MEMAVGTYVSTAEAAELLEVSTMTVRRLCHSMGLGTRHGRDLFLSPEDVEAIKNRPAAARRTGLPGLFTTRDAAAILEISDAQVRRLCIDHERGEKVGRDRMLSQEDIDFLRNRPGLGRPKKAHDDV